MRFHVERFGAFVMAFRSGEGLVVGLDGPGEGA